MDVSEVEKSKIVLHILESARCIRYQEIKCYLNSIALPSLVIKCSLTILIGAGIVGKRRDACYIAFGIALLLDLSGNKCGFT